MSFSFDPRGDITMPEIGPSRAYRAADSLRDQLREHRKSMPVVSHAKRSHRRPCHDWIFSTASNVHVAIDRASFKTYTAFKSYVLTVSDHRQLPVKGTGSVEINLKRAPDSNEAHTITLDNVLHVPNWLCNIFSDIYFPGRPFEHSWTDHGILFMRRKEDGNLRCWGFTEDFFGLEKLSVVGAHHGRSPMMEDKEREVFSVNVTWPQGQRDKWEVLNEA